MFPTPYSVSRVPWSSSGTDVHGNPVDVYGTPVAIDVYGWSTPSSSGANREPVDDRVIVDMQLFVPPDTVVDHRDRFVLPTGTFEVEGEIADYNHGPFGFRPGSVINLRRVEG